MSSGRRAREARKLFNLSQKLDPVSTEPEHYNVRKHEVAVPSKAVDPTTGLPMHDTIYAYLTSTVVIPAKRFYRTIKRRFHNGELG